MALQDEERRDFLAWFEQLHRKGTAQRLKFVLTARSSEGFSKRLLHGGSKILFDVDRQSHLERDTPLLLDKAAEMLADPAIQELRSANLTRTKPFHLRFVALRRGKTDEGLDVAGTFEEIIESDLKTLWNEKGLAVAVSTLAYFHFHFHPHLSRKAFLLLADRRNPQYPLAPFAEWPDPLNYYLHSYRNPTNTRKDAEEYLGFIKDDFAETIVAKASVSRSHAENCWFADAVRLIREADAYSASMLFYRICHRICHKRPEIWPAAQKKTMISSQLERGGGNSHHAYAWLLGIFADETERWEMIEQYLGIAPKNIRFAGPLLKWGKKAAPEQIRSAARKLLEVEGQHPFVICTALNLLGKEAEDLVVS